LAGSAIIFSSGAHAIEVLKKRSVSKLPVRSPSTSFLKVLPFSAEAR